jgi:hypothetical protein
MASSVQEKEFWVSNIRSALQKDVGPYKSLRANLSGGKNHALNSLLNIHCQNSNYRVPTLLACLVGDVCCIVRTMSVVCKDWHCALKISNDNTLFWHWIIRHGTIYESERWKFWKHILGADSILSLEDYELFRSSTSDFVRYEIEKDVNRSFGLTNKRAVQRRYVMILITYIIYIYIFFT